MSVLGAIGSAVKAASSIAKASKNANKPENKNNKTAAGVRAVTNHVKNAVSNATSGGSSRPQAQVQQPYHAKLPDRVNFDDYRTELLTVEDIAKKYGFDYSRDYAKSQAELIKRQQKEGLEETRNRVDNDLYSSIENLDRNYFQQYYDMMQNQATSGVNGALAADQALRANMGRQASASDLYRDNNAANYEIQNALGRLDAEATMYEDELYNKRLQEAFQNILAEGSFRQSENLAGYQGALQQRGQDIGVGQFNANMDFNRDQAQRQYDQWLEEMERQRERDDVSDDRWMKEFERIVGRDNVEDARWRETTDWQKMLDEAGLTGYYNDVPTFAREQFETAQEWQEHTFNNMSASEKANFEWLRENLGEQMAWNMFELKERRAMEEAMAQAQIDAYTNPGYSNVGQGPGPTNTNSTVNQSVSDYYSQYRVSSPFGMRKDPFTGIGTPHYGVDLEMPKGEPVPATVEGAVVYAGMGQPGSGYGGYGNVVVIQDADGRTHQYSHLDSVNVKTGQNVTSGQIVGAAGSTGRSTGNHLEYMVKDPKGTAVDPMPFLGL